MLKGEILDKYKSNYYRGLTRILLKVVNKFKTHGKDKIRNMSNKCSKK